MWNDKVKLIISDVDDTIAKVFGQVQAEMITEIEKLLVAGVFIFFISGQSYPNIHQRVIQFIHKNLRKNVLVGYCNGAEVAGFDEQGNRINPPLFSVTRTMENPVNPDLWKKVTDTLIAEFQLTPYPVMAIDEFKRSTANEPFAILFDNRELQISFDFINTLESVHWIRKGLRHLIREEDKDIRIPIQKRARELLNRENLPIEPHLAGTCAIDFNIKGVTKALPLEKLIVLGEAFDWNLPHNIVLSNHDEVEIWGDNFSNGNSDFYMSAALPRSTRSISFRKENPELFPLGYNIVLWNGNNELHEGLLEYLRTR